MDEQVNNENPVRLPESLQAQLRAFERRLYVTETVVAVCGGLCGVFLTYALLFASDRVWETPLLLRLLLSLCGGAALAWFWVWWLRNWWWKKRDARQLARLVQHEYRRLGDRLLGAVELANGTELPENISPALCRAAIEQVAGEAATFDFEKAVPTRKPRAWAIALAALAAVVVVPLGLFPDAGLNALRRWMAPFAPVPRYTFVSIDELPAELVVPHGEKFEIACVLREHSRWKPVSAACRFENQAEIKAAVESGRAVFAIPGQTKPGGLRVRIGDVAKRIQITPVFRPELVRLTADVTLPEYLKRPPRALTIENGRAEFLEGSQVTVRGVVSREIQSARVSGNASGTLATAGAEFRTAAVKAEALTNCIFTWTDRYGLSAGSPFELKASVIKDEPPMVECRGIGRSVAILEDERVTIEAGAEDDYGLKELELNWKSAGNKERGTEGIEGTLRLGEGTPETRTLTGQFVFSPVVAHVPEETMVTICAMATDYYPGRKPAASPVHRVYVLSRSRHAKLLQEQMEQIQGRLEDVAREEERLMDANKALTNQAPGELASEKSTESIKASETAERDNAAKLKRLEQEGEKLLQEGMKNKDIGEETLKKWAELLESMNEVAAQEMEQSSQALDKAGDNKEQRGEQMDKAIQKEQEALKKLKGMGKDINQALEDMMARNFVNRLLAAAGVEGEISGGLKILLPEIVGSRPQDLPEEKGKALRGLATRQDATRKDLKAIQDDLAGFFSRTRIPKYDAVHSDMVERKTQEKLGEVAGMIGRNVGVQSIEQAEMWRDQFKAWAEMLGKKSGQGEGQGEGGDGQALSEDDMEILLALMRIRQREETLREQTRQIEDGKAGNKAYAADARKLGQKQSELADDTGALERRSQDEKLRGLVEKVGGEMMNATVFLRKPQTDAATIAIETEIIELLSSQIDMQMSEGKGSSSARAQALARMLMKALGISAGTGKAGGGSMAGGTTDKAGSGATGPATGSSPDERNVEKSGGIDSGDWPEEFRDALNGYFEQLDKE